MYPRTATPMTRPARPTPRAIPPPSVSIALTFIPPPGANVVNYEVSLLLQAGAILAIGRIFYRRAAA